MTDAQDLSFSYRVYKSGDVVVYHHGKLAATLRGDKASDTRRRLEQATPAQAQQLMARLTGNYKRGNERRQA